MVSSGPVGSSGLDDPMETTLRFLLLRFGADDRSDEAVSCSLSSFISNEPAAFDSGAGGGTTSCAGAAAVARVAFADVLRAGRKVGRRFFVGAFFAAGGTGAKVDDMRGSGCYVNDTGIAQGSTLHDRRSFLSSVFGAPGGLLMPALDASDFVEFGSESNKARASRAATDDVCNTYNTS